MNKHVFKAPVEPGGPLYWADESAEGGPGPMLAEPKLQKNAIEAVQFTQEGWQIITDNGEPSEPGGQYSCLTRESCKEWIRRNRPGAILMDGHTVTAYYTDGTGRSMPVRLSCTINQVEDLLGGPDLATTAPDKDGRVAIYRTSRNEGQERRAAAGKPAGPVLVIKTEKRPSGLLEPADDRGTYEKPGAPAGMPRFDPAFWTEASRMGVRSLREYLDRLPDDAVVHFCGTDRGYLHWCPETKALSFDTESLDDLPEYDGCEPAVMHGNIPL